MKEKSQIFYHGTAAETDFTVFDGDAVYLAPNAIEAQVFAVNLILSKGKKGEPRVLEIQAKTGRIKNIDEKILEVIDDGDDIDELIESEIPLARAEGYRYLEFEHPGVGNSFATRIALYPKEDLVFRNRLPIVS